MSCVCRTAAVVVWTPMTDQLVLTDVGLLCVGRLRRGKHHSSTIASVLQQQTCNAPLGVSSRCWVSPFIILKPRYSDTGRRHPSPTPPPGVISSAVISPLSQLSRPRTATLDQFNGERSVVESPDWIYKHLQTRIQPTSAHG